MAAAAWGGRDGGGSSSAMAQRRRIIFPSDQVPASGLENGIPGYSHLQYPVSFLHCFTWWNLEMKQIGLISQSNPLRPCFDTPLFWQYVWQYHCPFACSKLMEQADGCLMEPGNWFGWRIIPFCASFRLFLTNLVHCTVSKQVSGSHLSHHFCKRTSNHNYT